MLLRKVKLENLLSFRNTEVELRALNVLIGANASGKSNLIEAIGLLQATPVDLSTAILRLGGVRVVCSLATPSPVAAIECNGINDEPLQYRLEFSEEAHGFTINTERLGSRSPDAEPGGDVTYFFRRDGGSSGFGDAVETISPAQSIFRLYKTPADPTPITRIGHKLEEIRVYREFRTTGDSQTRRGVSTSTGRKSLDEGGDNLAVVLLDMDFKGLHDRIRAYLHRFCDRFNDVKVNLDGPIAKTYIEDSGLLEPLISWRLSDGTLKFLCLLAVLIEKDLPPLICIEEPEVGLHPEAVQIVAEALVEASERIRKL